MKMKTWFIMLVGLIVLSAGTLWAKSGAELLEEGIYAEEIEGDLFKAIKLYDQVIKTDGGKRSHVAQAMYHKGMCFMSLGKEQPARETFEMLVHKFSEQSQLIEQAQLILNELNMIDPAALMPAETLHYVEIGSPGQQVETILNMIQGTLLEDSLNQMGAGGGMAAILNPSMIAELKKTKGAAFGLLDFDGNEPDFISVLYPGRSDALWGMIKAGIGMGATPGKPIGEFQTAVIDKEIGIAYNDTVLIISKGPDRVQEAIAKYHGKGSGKALADQAAFIKSVDKKTRQRNTLTVWSDLDAIFGKMTAAIPADQMPQELVMANAILDLKNIDEALVELNLEDRRISMQESIRLKPGHQCLAYNLLRTSPLTQEGYAEVPPGAVGLISLGLSEPQNLEEQLQSLGMTTGIDVVRDLVNNVEQVNLFLVPVEGMQMSSYKDLLACAGLAVTSHDPQKTEAILNQYLMCMIAQKQIGRSNVASLNPMVLKHSAKAFEAGVSAVNTGPLKTSLSQWPPETGKAAVVNLGGLIKMLGPIWVAMGYEEEQEELTESIETLATELHETNLELYTVESDNRLTLNLSINELPPLGNCVEPIEKLVQAIKRSMTEQTDADCRGLRRTVEPIVLDGEVDAAWSRAEALPLSCIEGSIMDPADASARAKVLYDDIALYVLVEVTDENVIGNTMRWWDNDSVIIYLDADNSKDFKYMPNDYMLFAQWFNGNMQYGENMNAGHDKAEWQMLETDTGYVAEARIPWAQLGVAPEVGARIGFDIQVNDGDDAQTRDAVLSLHDKGNKAKASPWAFGTLCVQGIVGDWSSKELQKLNDGTPSGTVSLQLPPFRSEFPDGITVFLKANPTAPGNWARFVELGNGEASDNIIFGREAMTDNLCIEAWNGADRGQWFSASDGMVNGEWHLYTMTIKRNGSAAVYRDGEQLSTGWVNPVNDVMRSVNLVGRASWSETDSFKGEIGFIRIYNRALDPDEIAEVPEY